MTVPRVSVVIPTYNRGKLLVQAVNSVLTQTFGDLEVIVADDGSDDGSPELAAELGDARVELLTLDHSGIPAVARNAGLARARGDLVAFLDSDDVWFPEKLERQVAVLDTVPSIGLVCSNARVIDENGDEIRQLYLRPEQGASGDVLGKLLDVNFVISSSAVARRAIVAQVGGFSEELAQAEDYDLWLRIAAISETAYLPEPLLDYRQHSGSMQVGLPRTAYWACLLTALENLDGFLDVDDARRKTLVPRHAQFLVQLARAQRAELGRRAAARSLGKALRKDAVTAAAALLWPPASRVLGRTKSAVQGAFRRVLALR